MGRDKALIQINGESQIDRVIDAALAVSDEVCVVGRQGARADITWLLDETPGLGPMGGLKTALSWLNRPVLLVACDMPRLDEAALRWLNEEFSRSSAACGLAVSRDGRFEPLFSVYSPELLGLIDRSLEAGRLSLSRLIARAEFDQVELPEELAKKLLNINTPEELARFRKSKP